MMRVIILPLLSVAAGLIAIAVLLDVVAIDFASIAARVHEVGLSGLALVCLASFVQFAISAHKWRVVLATIGPNGDVVPSPHFSLVLASLAALVAQVLPLYVAAPVLRSAVARYAVGTPVVHGALASAIEQAFDVLAFSLLLIPTLVLFGLTFVGIETLFTVWLIATAATLIFAFALGGKLSARVARNLNGLPCVSKAWETRLEAFAGIDVPMRRQLLSLSLARNAMIIAQVVLVARFAGFAVPLDHLVYGHTVVQAAQLAAVTPGNLGLAEWTWVGVLGRLGNDFATIAAFSLTLRVVTVASYVVVSCLVLMCSIGRILMRKLVSAGATRRMFGR